MKMKPQVVLILVQQAFLGLVKKKKVHNNILTFFISECDLNMEFGSCDDRWFYICGGNRKLLSLALDVNGFSRCWDYFWSGVLRQLMFSVSSAHSEED